MIASASDISPVAAELQAKVRDVASRAKDPQQRKALDQMIKTQIIPEFQKYADTQSGVSKNNWVATIGTAHTTTSWSSPQRVGPPPSSTRTGR